jgi:uncharacterized membrane protein
MRIVKIIGKVMIGIMAFYGVIYSIVLAGVAYTMISKHGVDGKSETGMTIHELLSMKLKDKMKTISFWLNCIFRMSIKGWRWCLSR